MSPYYARLYKDITDDFILTDLPVVNKRDLLASWDEWIADRRLTLTDVYSFMKNIDYVGRKLNNKYLVFTTSGSTGNPLVCLCDKTTNYIMGAVNALRALPERKIFKLTYRSCHDKVNERKSGVLMSVIL